MTSHAPLPRVLKQGQLKTSAPAASAPPPHACAAPAVRLVRSGNVVKSIRVDCPCGRSIEIECLLDEAALRAAERNP
jgi:hypothetical protein